MLQTKFKKYLLLSSIIILFLWLIVNIPFVIKSSYLKIIAENPAVAIFLNFKFTLISLMVLFLSIILFNFNKEFILKYRTCVVFFSAFIYSVFRILKSFDVTDNGFHLTKSWGLFHGSVKENIDFWVGSSFVNGLWLSIYGEPNVLWARFGYVIVVTLIILFSYKIYNLYFKELRHLLIFLPLVFFFIHFNYYLSANYDNMPLLVTLIGSWLLLKDEQCKSYNFVLSGFFWGLAVWLKFNYILAGAMPVILGIYLYQINDNAYIKKTAQMLLGYIISISLGIIILLSTNTFSSYSNYIDNHLLSRKTNSNEQQKIEQQILDYGKKSKISTDLKISDNVTNSFFFLSDSLKNDSLRKDPVYNIDLDQHNMSELFNNYFIDYWKVFDKSLHYFFLFTIVILLFSNKINSKIIKFGVSAGFVFYIFYTAYNSLIASDYVFISSLMLCGYIYIVFSEDKETKYYLPFLLILSMVLFSFPGSNLSFNVVYRSGAGLLFMALPLAYLYDCKRELYKIKFDFSYYTIIITSFVIMATIKSWGYNNVHRDLPDRNLLITMFKSKQLFGIHTMPQRVQVVDELLDYFSKEKYTRNATPALFMDWLPMFYYLTETNCILNNPWFDAFEIFTKDFDQATKSNPPKYIVFSSKFTRNPTWPLNDDNYKQKDKIWIAGIKQDDYVRYWMKSKTYDKVFVNEMFEVWKLN